MSIITKRGDQGKTDLLFGKSAEKTSDRIEALGAVDELNAQLGLARVHASDPSLITWIDDTQKALINLMGEVATLPSDLQRYIEKGYGKISDEQVSGLETLALEYQEQGNTFKGWIRPGEDDSLLTAQLHICRTVCRRAERRCWALEMESRTTCLYLNRLADVLWLIANPKA